MSFRPSRNVTRRRTKGDNMPLRVIHPKRKHQPRLPHRRRWSPHRSSANWRPGGYSLLLLLILLLLLLVLLLLSLSPEVTRSESFEAQNHLPCRSVRLRLHVSCSIFCITNEISFTIISLSFDHKLFLEYWFFIRNYYFITNYYRNLLRFTLYIRY